MKLWGFLVEWSAGDSSRAARLREVWHVLGVLDRRRDATTDPKPERNRTSGRSVERWPRGHLKHGLWSVVPLDPSCRRRAATRETQMWERGTPLGRQSPETQVRILPSAFQSHLGKGGRESDSGAGTAGPPIRDGITLSASLPIGIVSPWKRNSPCSF